MNNTQLYNYALISGLKNLVGGSLPKSLCLFAKPIIADMGKDEQFDIDEFINQMKLRYNIEWNSNIMGAIIPHLLGEDLIFEKRISADNKVYLCKEVVLSSDSRETVNDNINSILEEFKKFIKSNPTLFLQDMSDNNLLDILTNYLSKNDWVDNEIKVVGKSVGGSSDCDYICARFISDIKDERIMQFVSDLSGNIKFGVLLQEFAVPTTIKNDFNDQNIFLDNTLLLSYLGVSGKTEESNAKNLIDRLKDYGAKICVYSHTCDEGINALDTILKPSDDLKYGPTWNAISNKETNLEYVEYVARNFDELLNKHNINIIETDKKAEKDSHFAEIYEQLNFHESMQRNTSHARSNDALSVLYIIHKNKVERKRDVLSLKNIFITTNPKLVSAVNRYMIEGESTAYNLSVYANPFIVSSKFEFLLWLSHGNYNDFSIPMSQIIYDSDRVRRLNPEIFRIVQKTVSTSLNTMDSSKLEELLQEPRYKQALSDETLNNVNTAKKLSSKQIMAVLEKETKREVFSLKIQQGKKLKSKDNEIEKLKKQLYDNDLRDENRIQDIMISYTKNNSKLAKWMIGAAAFLCIILSSILTVNYTELGVGALATTIISIILILSGKYNLQCFVINKVEALFNLFSKYRIKKRLGYSGLIDKFNSLINDSRIDWKTFTVLQRESLLPEFKKA